MSFSDQTDHPHLVVVRHAEPLTDPDQSPQDWRLSSDGRRDSAELARRLSELFLTRLVSSTETKAVETATIIAGVLGIPTSTDEGLNEIRRPWLDVGFERAVTAYLEGESAPGWEPLDEVRERVARVVDDVVGQGLVGVVTHGTAMTVWLATRVPLDTTSFWVDLRLPDAWLVAGSAITRL